MPEYKIQKCDCCSEEMGKNVLLIYEFSFWDKKKFEVKRIDYILRQGIALMVCSKECLGKYLFKLIEGD